MTRKEAKAKTLASNNYRKELGKMEKRICGAIHGAVRVLQGSHPRVTLEEHEYFGINLDEPTTVARFADGDVFNDGPDLVVGVALVGKGKSATVAIIKGDNFTNDLELYYTGELDVNLLTLTQALEQLELMIAEKF